MPLTSNALSDKLAPATDVLLAVKDLHVHYVSRAGTLKALNGMSLSVRRSEMCALVGESGAGKSTVAWSVLGLNRPGAHVIRGTIEWRGESVLGMSLERMSKLRGREIGLIVSNPRAHLHPLTKVGKQIQAVGAVTRGGDARAAHDAALDALRRVEMPDPLRIYSSYPHELSGGMAQRVVIAMALINAPQLVIADEPTSALDVTVQRQVLDLLASLIHQQQSSALIITHDLGVVAQYCNRATVMYAGQAVEVADTQRLFDAPRHPYTQSLLARTRRRRPSTSAANMNTTASLAGPQALGCPLSQRCPVVMNECTRIMPELVEVEPDHWVRCLRHSGPASPSTVGRAATSAGPGRPS